MKLDLIFPQGFLYFVWLPHYYLDSVVPTHYVVLMSTPTPMCGLQGYFYFQPDGIGDGQWTVRNHAVVFF